MLKKVANNMKSCMYNVMAPVYSEDLKWQNKCYILGYLDAYFDELVYIVYINEGINNERKLKFYSLGYSDGIRNRKSMVNNKPDVLKKEKEQWLKDLALFDALNKIDSSKRNFSDKSYKFYETYKNNGIYSFRSGKFSLSDNGKSR